MGRVAKGSDMNYKLPRERKESPVLTALTGLGLAAVWFAAFWILGA